MVSSLGLLASRPIWLLRTQLTTSLLVFSCGPQFPWLFGSFQVQGKFQTEDGQGDLDMSVLLNCIFTFIVSSVLRITDHNFLIANKHNLIVPIFRIVALPLQRSRR